MQPLDDAQVAAFVANKLDEQCASSLMELLTVDADWCELSRCPRVLDALCRLAAETPRFASLATAELIDLLCQALLASTETGPVERDSPVYLILEALALEMLRGDSEELGIKRVREIAREAAGASLKEDGARALLRVLVQSGIVCGGESDDNRETARFRSPLFRHFFAAISLRRSFQRNSSVRRTLPAYPWNHGWERTLAFAYALANNRLGLLRDLVGSGTDEVAISAAAGFLALQESDEYSLEFLRIDPLSFNLHFFFGHAFCRLKRPDLARRAYEAAARLEPARARVHQELADVLVETGEFAGAASAYEIAARLSDNDLNYHLGMARIFAQQRKWPDAKEQVGAAKESLRLAEADIHHQTGHVCEGEGNLDEALSQFQTALELSQSAHYWLHLGQLRRKRGEPQLALEALERCIDLHPDNPDGRRELGLIYESLEKLDRSIEQLKRAASSQKRRADVHADLGRVYGKTGQLAQAQAELRRALRLEPAYAPAFAELGEVYETGNQLENALESFRKASQLCPLQSGYLERMGRVLKLLGRLGEAEVELRVAARLDPSKAGLFELLGSVMAAQGRFEEALADYRRAAELNPGEVVHLHNVGVMHSRLGDFRAAEQVLSEALRLSGEGHLEHCSRGSVDASAAAALAETHCELGLALEMLGNHDEALSRYQRAAELMPLSEAYWTKQGRVCLKMGLAEKSASAFQRSVSLNPQDASLWIELGAAHESAGQPSKALEAYENAIKLECENSTPFVRSGVILRDLGKTDQAIRSFENALKLFPRNAEAHFQLGRLLLEAGSLDAAMLNCLAAVEYDPNNPTYRIALGRCFSARGRSNEASAQLRKAVALAPELAEAHYHLARVFLENGLRRDALESASRATELDAANAEYARFAGGIAGQTGDIEQAIRFLREATRRAPASDSMHYDLGAILERAGEHLKALDEYRRAFELSPDSVKYEFEIGRLRMNLGEYHQAVEVLLRVVASDPSHAGAQALLGDSLARLGYFEGALDRYELATQLQPGAAEHWRGKGQVLAMMGRPADAAGALRQAVALDASGIAARESLAKMLARLGQWEEAHLEFAEIARRSGLTARGARALSDVCSAMGRYEEAAEWLKRSVEFEPHPDALAELGSVMELLGEPLEARSQLLRALERSGNEAHLRRRLGVLSARLGKHGEAIVQLEEMANEKKMVGAAFADPFVKYSLAAAYGSSGRLDDGVRQMDELSTLVPRGAGLLAARGSLGRRVVESKGESAPNKTASVEERAIDDLVDALSLNPALILAHEELGILCELKGETGAALDHYLRAISINPFHPGARCRAARTFLRTERQDDALKVLKDALEGGQTDAALFSEIGTAYESKGMLLEALESYRRALVLRDDEADFRHNMARVLALLQRPDARKELERAIALRPQEAEWHWELGALLEAGGNHERAIEEYRRAVAEAPDRGKYYRSLGRLLCQMDRLGEASDALNRAISLEPVSDNYAEMSRVRIKQGRFQDALKHAERALKNSPEDPNHRLAHAVALKYSGQTEKSLSALEHLVADAPDSSRAHFELGLMEEERGLTERALSFFQRAVELDSGEVVFKLAVARANRILGRYAEAGVALRQILRKPLRNLDVLHEAARLAEAQNKLPEAIDTYRRAIKIEPRGALYRDMAHALARAKRYDEALEAMRSALKREPRNADWVSEMGEICETRGSDAEAIGFYQQAIKLDPRTARFHCNLGTLFKRLGKYDEAIVELKRALELEPDYNEAYQQLSAAQASALLRKTIGS